MGVDYNVHLGPYVTCKPRESTRKEDRYGCINPECGKHRKKADRDAKFCAACGHENGQFTVNVKVSVDPYDVIGDAFSRADSSAYGGGKESVVLIPNEDRKAPREFSFNPLGEEGATEITPEMVREEMSWFFGAFGEDVRKLNEAFDDVTIRWGMILYAT